MQHGIGSTPGDQRAVGLVGAVGKAEASGAEAALVGQVVDEPGLPDDHQLRVEGLDGIEHALGVHRVGGGEVAEPAVR